MPTYTPKRSDINRDWHVIDAQGAVLGKIATEAATLLRGKHKPTWVPNMDCGDHVVVVNASQIDVTIRKTQGKIYHWHTRYPGGIRSRNLGAQLQRQPEQAIVKAVRGMLPKGALGRQMLKKLKVYAGPSHPHGAQNPAPRAVEKKVR